MLCDTYINTYIHTYIDAYIPRYDVRLRNQPLELEARDKIGSYYVSAYVCMYVGIYVYLCMSICMYAPVSEEEAVARTVHGLHRKLLIFDLEHKHILHGKKKEKHFPFFGYYIP